MHSFPPQRTVARRLVLILAALVAALLALWLLGLAANTPAARAQEPSPTYDPTRVTVPFTPPSARAGRALYLENCAPCHGDTGAGDGPTAVELSAPPAMFIDRELLWQRDPAELFHTTKFGKLEGLMPPWGNRMNDGQIWDAVSYAWSLHTSEDEIAQGAALYADACASCHGDAGRGDGPDAEGDLPDFTNASYTIYRSQNEWLAGWQEAHADVGGDWARADQDATLEFVRTFGYAPPWQSPYQPGEGVIRGQVVQGSAGGPAVAGLQATLDAYLEFDRVAVFTTTVDAGGGFEFSNLALDPGLNYIVTIRSDGMRYGSDFLNLTPVTSTVETEIAVYATTDDPTVVSIDRLHWIVDPQPGALLVGQIYAFGNTSDRTFVGQTLAGADQPVTFAMHIPPNAQDITFDSGALGDRFVQVGPAIFDTLPVVPGAASRQIVVRYVLPFAGTEASVQQELLYPSGEVSLLVADQADLKVEADGLQFVSVERMGERAYQFWVAENLPATTLGMRLQGLLPAGAVAPNTQGAAAAGTAGSTAATAGSAPAISARSVPPPLEAWAGGLIAAFTTAGLVGIFLWARSSGTLRSHATREELTELRETLIERIAHLDDLHALGDVNESEWLRQRAQFKAQLVDVVGRLNRGKRTA